MTSFLHSFFERTVDRMSKAVAVDDDGCCTSYGDLETQANRIANLLIGLGCEPNERVVVFAEKGARQYAGVLGTLKAEGCWVPFNAAFPLQRQAYLLDVLAPRAIIADATTFEAALAARSANGADIPVIVQGMTVDVDDTGIYDQSAIDTYPDTRPSGGNLSPDDLAYIIFTSGSTGTPKGVMVRHRNVATFLDLCSGFFDIPAGARFAHFSELTFDPSVFDLFHAWATGGTVVPLNRRRHRVNPGAFLRDRNINVLFCVPTLIASIAEAEQLTDPTLDCVTHLLLTGEVTPPALVRKWYDAHPQSTVYNMYGTTETAIVSHWYKIPHDIDGRSPVPVGYVLPDMRVRLLDNDGHEVPLGVAGESVVSGPQVSAGYWANPYLTSRVFTADPEQPSAPVTVYHTGDVLRCDRDGLYVYVGRKDTQMKLRGHRVELGEVENILMRCQGVREAAVIVVSASERAVDKRLVAFVRLDEDKDVGVLRHDAGEMLPDFMVPTAILPVLKDFPRNMNGKIDRQVLSRLAADSLR